MSELQSRDFAVNIHAPLAQGGEYLETINSRMEDYAHSIAAFGGFHRCTFRISDRPTAYEEWLEDGLGRHIEVYDEALEPMWEGFVNEIVLTMGNLVVRRGPLTDIANRVKAVYSQIDPTTDPPTLGIRRQTPTLEDTVSQDRYGVWAKVLSLAGVTDDNAIQLRDTYLREHARPETTSDYAGSGSTVRIAIQCMGYFHSLAAYPYNQTSQTGLMSLSDKIAAVLQADPNGWIADDYSRVAGNDLEVMAWENNNYVALDLIRGLAAMGDDQSRRHLFGVYEERRPVYGPAPTEHDYEIRLNDPAQAIRDIGGGVVQPWRVRPGRWAFFSDFLVGFSGGATLRDDPRMLFIESVTYHGGQVIPELTGGKVATLRQRLARLGLGGIHG